MGLILVLLSLLATIIGFLTLTQATMGVGILAVACILAIFARIAQADAQHKELKKMLGPHENKSPNPGSVIPKQPE